jgi:hypothetical protein
MINSNNKIKSGNKLSKNIKDFFCTIYYHPNFLKFVIAEICIILPAYIVLFLYAFYG